MPFKSVDAILETDSKFATLYVVKEGQLRPMGLADHHAAIAGVELKGSAPADVQAVFDRARNVLLYAYFDYDLLVVGELQAFGALELALKHRLGGHGGAPRGLRDLVNRSRKAGILPPVVAAGLGVLDPIEALIPMRNSLSHGSGDVHSPAMALGVLEACASEIDQMFPSSPATA